LDAWATPAFEAVFKDEVGRLGVESLPLQQALSQSSHANGDSMDVMLIGSSEEPGCIRVRAGIFYTGVIPGCACADDPAPDSEYTEYCEVRFDIDRETAATRVTLLPG